MKNRLLIALVLAGLCIVQAVAQGPLDLDRLDEKLSRHVRTKMPTWNHKRGESITGSENVLIENWALANRGVRVSIVQHKSPDDARAAIREFVKYARAKEALKGLGDEAYAWGYELSDVVFTRGRFNVYVSAGANIDEDPDARALSQSEKRGRQYSEMRRLSREFAKHLGDAIDLP